MAYELTGKLIEKFDTVQVSDRFRKREFVDEKSESGNDMQFVEQIKFQLTQDRCDLIESFNINDEVKVSFNIKGRRWEKDGRVSYFTNLEAWRLEKVNSEAAGPESERVIDINEEIEAAVDDDQDDLPF